MSWGERSCEKYGTGCKYNPTMATCNVDCAGYVSNGKEPDSKSFKKQQPNIEILQAAARIARKAFLTIFVIPGIWMLAGCQESNYVHRSFDDGGKLTDEIKINYDIAMANKEIKDLLIILPDGTVLIYGNSRLTTDPNSAKAIGELLESAGTAAGKFTNKTIVGD